MYFYRDSINFVIVPIFFFFRSNCVLDSTAVSVCKIPLDTSNGNKRKTASTVLKRGRTILKKRYDPRKHTLRNSVLTTTTNGRDLHKVKFENVDVVFPSRNGDLPLNSDTSGKSALKKAIKLEDKLISGEEIEFCPAEYTPDKAGACLVSDNSKRSKIPSDEFSKSCLNSDKSAHTPTDTYPIIAEDYPKLYITVTNTSDKNAMAKTSLLKSIRGIQSADSYGDSYGINISNSRFFVPKNYIFSGVECSMDDLKFEVDPEMGKLLQRSYSNSQASSTGSSTPTNVESDWSSLNNNTIVKAETPIIDRTISNDSAKEHNLDLDSRCSKVFPMDTSPENSISKESDKTERKQRRFLKKRESKPSCEIVDSLLDETTKNRELVSTSKVSHDLQTEAVEREMPLDNELWTAKHVIIADCEITKKSASDVSVAKDGKIFGTLEDSGKPSSPDEIGINSLRSTRSTNIESEEIKSPYEFLNVPSKRRKSYPFPFPPKISSKSTCFPSIFVTPPFTRSLNIHSGIEATISEPLKYSSVDQEKRDESLACNEESQGSKCPNLSETNRANRIRFLQNSLEASACENDNFLDNSHVEGAASSESSKLYTNEESKGTRIIANSSEPVFKDQDLAAGRTSSLREKFETIVENVELRTTPGRCSQIGVSCDRKSLAPLS